MQTIISENVKRLRKVKELTQCELAKLAGVSQATVSRIEDGGRVPRVAITQKLAKALGQTPESLVKGAIEREEEYNKVHSLKNVQKAKQVTLEEAIGKEHGEELSQVELLEKILKIETTVAKEALAGWEQALKGRIGIALFFFLLGLGLGALSLMSVVGLLS